MPLSAALAGLLQHLAKSLCQGGKAGPGSVPRPPISVTPPALPGACPEVPGAHARQRSRKSQPGAGSDSWSPQAPLGGFVSLMAHDKRRQRPAGDRPSLRAALVPAGPLGVRGPGRSAGLGWPLAQVQACALLEMLHLSPPPPLHLGLSGLAPSQPRVPVTALRSHPHLSGCLLPSCPAHLATGQLPSPAPLSGLPETTSRGL